ARAWASAFTWERTVQELCAAIRKCLEGTRGEEPATDEDSGTPQAGPTASPKLFREDSIPKLSRVG
ncbi:MAG: hypothetical protein JO112_02440, partial [Planctomycetes bacterium]|nr:hypothetical protein [Planctomycetota bacterium]